MALKNNIFIISLLLILGFSACEKTEKIDDFPLRHSKLVVNCYFSENEEWQFQVSKSLSVLDNAQLKLIDNATVKLFEDTSLLATVSEQNTMSWYTIPNIFPQVGHSYHIEVSSPDFGATLKASDNCPVPVPIDNVNLSITDSSFYSYVDYDGTVFTGGDITGKFDLSFDDPSNSSNYYQISVYSIDTIWYDEYNFSLNKREIYLSSDDVVISGNSEVSSDSPTLLFSDELFNGQKYSISLSFNDWLDSEGKYYFLELESITKAGYLYRKTVEEFSNSQYDMFAEPVQVYSNIDGGFGIFAGYSSYVDSVYFSR